jgi:hypothetical protein
MRPRLAKNRGVEGPLLVGAAMDVVAACGLADVAVGLKARDRRFDVAGGRRALVVPTTRSAAIAIGSSTRPSSPSRCRTTSRRCAAA